MFWKILLTAGLILAAYLTFKARRRGRVSAELARPPVFPPGLVRRVAYWALAVMLLGSGWSLWRGWEHANRVLKVQVANANTGVVAVYEARRRDIEGRVIRTLDGREIRLADVERMILIEEGSRH